MPSFIYLWSNHESPSVLSLSSLVPLLYTSRARAMPQGNFKRLIVFHHPHGTVQRQFVPSGSAEDCILPFILEPLTAFQDHLTVLSGIDNVIPRYNTVSSTPQRKLYISHRPTISHTRRASIECKRRSFEQHIADRFGGDTPFPRLDFAIGGPRTESGILSPSESAYFWYMQKIRYPIFKIPLWRLSGSFPIHWPIPTKSMRQRQEVRFSHKFHKSMEQYQARLPLRIEADLLCIKSVSHSFWDGFHASLRDVRHPIS